MADELHGQGRTESPKPSLKTMRLRHGLSINELAARAGVAPRTIGVIERGEATPHMATIRKLSHAFDCAFDAIAWPNDPYAR